MGPIFETIQQGGAQIKSIIRVLYMYKSGQNPTDDVLYPEFFLEFGILSKIAINLENLNFTIYKEGVLELRQDATIKPGCVFV